MNESSNHVCAAPGAVSNPSLDLVCIGRAGVDFYAEQVGSRLEDVGSFAKYIGGSSTNIAACSSRMGLKTALITRVGNEHMGEFIREQLKREGVDTSYVISDPERLTALVVLGIKDRETFPLIFYRENCADMAISVDDIDAGFIASARALLITGTHFSTDNVYKTCKHALAIARERGVKTVLDIDYRPVLWGLTGKGDGETRFVANDNVSKHLQSIVADFDLIVGTEEEIHIAGGTTDTLQALNRIRELSDATLVLKRGPYGASVYEGAIPDDLDKGVTVKGVSVDVLNVLGAGDGFISGFLRGWINGESHEQALTYANACGALVVSRHGCTPAMPTRPELDYYLANANRIARPDLDPELNFLHRVSTRSVEWPQLMVHAFDHRLQFEKMASKVGATTERLEQLKLLLLQATVQVIEKRNIKGQAGLLCDGKYGQEALNHASGQGLWVARPVEEPQSRPLRFEGGRSIGSILESWPQEQVVKCLLFYSAADDIEILQQQDSRLLELYDACCHSGHELMLEIIPPREALPASESLWMSVDHIYNLGIRPDWWKLPALSTDSTKKLCDLINERDSWCRGIVILGLNAPFENVVAGLEAAAKEPLVKGFAVGRTLFAEAAELWLANKINDNELVGRVAANYTAMVDAWLGFTQGHN